MRIWFTLTKSDGVAVGDTETMSWHLRRQGAAVSSGQGDCALGGNFQVDVAGVARFDSIFIECPGYKSTPVSMNTVDDMLVAKAVVLAPYVAPVRVAQVQVQAAVSQFNIAANNTTDWDWLIWETEGNSDPKYERGGRQRQLGLYRLNYDLLRKAGGQDWAAAHQDGTLGGGSVKVAILDELDYGDHSALMLTLLPCFSIQGGKPAEPGVNVLRTRAAMVSRALTGEAATNSVDVLPPMIVMPFNYDDNSARSKVIGKVLTLGLMADAQARRLTAELPRWATASRSTITSFLAARLDLLPHAQNAWALRPDTPDDASLAQVRGDNTAMSFLQYQANNANTDKKYYSVKTGVDYVSTQNQGINNKDLLESNSIHAMSRSNVIAGKMKKAGATRFEAQYQIEILSILLGGGNSWDGIQIREIGNAGVGAVWFPALAIPCHGKAFAEAWSPNCNWVDFWTTNFATPLGRAKAEMLVYFGLQHMTSNAQNFLVEFDRLAPASAAKHVILRDIGDTILNTCAFDVLKEIDPTLFATTWDKEIADVENGIVLTPGNATIGGGYANPQITRIGAGIVFFFPPFLKGDVDTKANPAKAVIIGKWCLAHNEGFLAYMRDKVGYAEIWSAGADALDPALAELIRKSADLSISGKSDTYARLAQDVVQLSATTRQRLIGEIKAEIQQLAPTSSADVLTLQKLVAGHELMICAEIHCYIQSNEGKQALRDLHASGSAKPATGDAPKCLSCGDLKPVRPVGWYACSACQSLFCTNCGAQLGFPRGTSVKMRQFTEERGCNKANCNGLALPMPS